VTISFSNNILHHGVSTSSVKSRYTSAHYLIKGLRSMMHIIKLLPRNAIPSFTRCTLLWRPRIFSETISSVAEEMPLPNSGWT